jgi:hypothetical protein
MATSSITVTDALTGLEVATESFTEDALSKHIQRVSPDRRRNNPAKIYSILLTLTGSASAAANIGGLRKLNANPDCYIKRIFVILTHAAAGVGVPIRAYRAATVAGGSQIAVADIPKLDTAAANTTLEVRTGAVTGTKANQPFTGGGGMEVVTTLQTGSLYELFRSYSQEEDLRLTADEGIIFDMALAGDVDDRYLVGVTYEEK